MSEYLIITKISDWMNQYNFQFRLNDRPLDWLCWVEIHSKNKSWSMLVYDEFHDLAENKPFITLYLILISLEDYEQTSDYLEWLKEYQIKQTANYLDYYKSLAEVYADFQEMLDPLESITSSWDYQHRSGEYAALLEL